MTQTTTYPPYGHQDRNQSETPIPVNRILSGDCIEGLKQAVRSLSFEAHHFQSIGYVRHG